MTITAENMSIFLKALTFAAGKHKCQRRKDMEASAYINHPIAVVNALWEIGKVHHFSTLVAGILHDTVEDTETTPGEIEALFGSEIRSIVEEVTDDKSLPNDERKRLQVEHAGSISAPARNIKLADKICNISDIIESPPSGWSPERKLEYALWGEEVVDRIRGTNENLERYFDELIIKVRLKCAK